MNVVITFLKNIFILSFNHRKFVQIFSGGKVESSGSDCDSNLDSELSSHSLPTHYQTGECGLMTDKRQHS